MDEEIERGRLFLEQMLLKRTQVLSEPHQQTTKNLSIGIWMPQLNRIRLTKVKGKLHHYMGYSASYEQEQPTEAPVVTTMDSSDEEEQAVDKKPKCNFLFPEEALYLCENSSLQIMLEREDISLPMSIQQCYESFFRDQRDSECQLDDYVIYSHLTRLGYILRRSSRNEEALSNYQRKDMHQDMATPLIKPSEYGTLSSNEMFERLDIIPNITLGDLKRMLSNKKANKQQSSFRPFFDLYMPNKNFRKSKPGEGIICRIVIQNASSSPPLKCDTIKLPQLQDFIQSCSVNDNVPNLCAFYNNGEILFYYFNFQVVLPRVY